MENNVPTQVCSSFQSLSVIQIRGQEPMDHESDEYVLALKRAGVGEVVRIPVLSFAFKNLGTLRKQLLEDLSIIGLILTSPRAVEAVQKSILDDSLDKVWKDRHVFCVGPKTASEALTKLGLKASLDPELIGDGKKLGEQVVSFFKKINISGKLLIPCSSIAKMYSVEKLEEAGFEVVINLVYETISIPDAPIRVRNVVDGLTGSTTVFVIFSPSNLKAILPEIKSLMMQRDIKIIAIGPTTKKAIEESGVLVWSTCPSPTPDGLISALRDRL